MNDWNDPPFGSYSWHKKVEEKHQEDFSERPIPE
jgi:hypothetical protein